MCGGNRVASWEVRDGMYGIYRGDKESAIKSIWNDLVHIYARMVSSFEIKTSIKMTFYFKITTPLSFWLNILYKHYERLSKISPYIILVEYSIQTLWKNIIFFKWNGIGGDQKIETTWDILYVSDHKVGFYVYKPSCMGASEWEREMLKWLPCIMKVVI